MIRYVKYTKVTREYHEVSHDDLDDWKFTDFERNGMFESLKGLEFVRLYFDFDFHTGDDIITNVDEIMKALDSIKVVFKDYVYAGYCCDKELYNKLPEEFRKSIELKDVDLGKPLSFHVVYPGSVISQDELCDIMTTKLYTHEVRKFADDKVYKKHVKEQLLRHPSAHKYEIPGDKSPEQYKGVNFDNIKCNGAASDLVATPYGSKQIITKEVWSQIFKPVEVKAPVVVEQKVVKQEVEGEEITNIDEAYKTKSFTMSKPCFEALYKGFEGLTIHGDKAPCNEEISLWPLFSALYVCVDSDNITDDDLDDALAFIKEHALLTENAKSKWDSQLRRAAANKNCTGPGALFTYMRIFNNDYYVKNVKKYCLRKCVATDDIKFDLKDEFSIRDIRVKGAKREYQIDLENEKLDYNAILNDLRRVLIIIDKAKTLYVFKQYDARTNRMTIDCCNLKDAKAMLKQLKVGTTVKSEKNNTIVEKTAWDVFDSNANNSMFYKRDITFYSEHPDDFSFYQGLKYNAVRNDVIVERFMNHIKHVWCKGDERNYKYTLSWFAKIIKNPLGRCGTALVVKGAEGTGKNTITDVICEILSGYSIPNVSRIESIVGRFNSAIENKKLIVCNEMSSTEMNSINIFDRLKAMITEPTIDIEVKGIDVRTVQNVSNYIFLSNNFNPIKITSGDRRYHVITPSDKYKGNRKYFNELYSDMMDEQGNYRKEFIEALVYYFMNYDDVVDLRDIPETEERIELQQVNKGAIECFVEEFCDEFASEDGMLVSEAFDRFKRFVIENGFKYACKKITFNSEMKQYFKCEKNGSYTRPARNKHKESSFMFTNEMKVKYSDLIKLKQEERDGKVSGDEE